MMGMTGRTKKQALQDDPDRISRDSAGCDHGFSVQGRPDTGHLQRVAFLAKSLSDGNRLRILILVSSGRKSVSAIVEKLDLSQPLVSHHLKELKRSLLVKVEREGSFVYYELADMRIFNVLTTLSEIAGDLLMARNTF